MYVDVERHGPFTLRDAFLRPYRDRPVPWGFGALSWVIYKRSYSRDESWWQTCRRVVEGTFTVLRAHCMAHGRPWDAAWAQEMAEDAYARLWTFKWTPPGRGLWIMGTRFMYERGGAALNNCGFVSTRDIAHDIAEPFAWMLGMGMLGVGVGFDTRGRDACTVRRPERSEAPFVVEDTREGWADALRCLLGAYAGRGPLPPRFDLSRIRPAGAPLHGFGGRASGPAPLREMLEQLNALYDAHVGERIDAPLIVDTMNLVGRCVVAGGIRRSAQIALGDPEDTSFLDLKLDRDKLRAWRWVSNNSVIAPVGMRYDEIVHRTARNGEPGFFWLDNARAYGRMGDPACWRDEEARGTNPCVEQTLWDHELCTLVETFPAHHADLADLKATLRVAFLYAKAVTLVETHDPRTNEVMRRNRRVGCSMTGIVQAINRHGYRRFLRWCDDTYGFVRRLDDHYAQWLAVPTSIKVTSVKPSGTVSLLAGATPGVHWDHAPYYIRRVRLGEDHPLVEMCADAGYPVEADAYSARTAVVSFPIRVSNLRRGKADVPLREKVDLAAQMQRYWSDNQVSCTAEFDRETEQSDLPRVLAAYEDRLKAIVFLPARGHGYVQPPYEAITDRDYASLVSGLRPLRGRLEHEQGHEARFCEGGSCEIDVLQCRTCRPEPNGPNEDGEAALRRLRTGPRR